MKITKFGHSCLLVQEGDLRVLGIIFLVLEEGKEYEF